MSYGGRGRTGRRRLGLDLVDDRLLRLEHDDREGRQLRELLRPPERLEHRCRILQPPRVRMEDRDEGVALALRGLTPRVEPERRPLVDAA
eukprot:3856192-Prymnesium_polylepis.1